MIWVVIYLYILGGFLSLKYLKETAWSDPLTWFDWVVNIFWPIVYPLTLIYIGLERLCTKWDLCNRYRRKLMWRIIMAQQAKRNKEAKNE